MRIVNGITRTFIPEGSRVSSDGPLGFDLFYQLILYSIHDDLRIILILLHCELCVAVNDYIRAVLMRSRVRSGIGLELDIERDRTGTGINQFINKLNDLLK